MDILIHRDGQQYGPYTLEQAQEYVINGTLIPATDLAWHEGMTEWLPLKDVLRQLVPAVPTSPQALPPPVIPPPTVPPVTGLTETKAEPNPKTFWIAFVLCLLLGLFGAHRFYLGKKSAWLMLISLGGLGLWWLVDVVLLLASQLKDNQQIPVINPKPAVTWPVAAVWLLICFASGDTKKESSSFNGGSLPSFSQKIASLTSSGSAYEGHWVYNINHEGVWDSGYYVYVHDGQVYLSRWVRRNHDFIKDRNSVGSISKDQDGISDAKESTFTANLAEVKHPDLTSVWKCTYIPRTQTGTGDTLRMECDGGVMDLARTKDDFEPSLDVRRQTVPSVENVAGLYYEKDNPAMRWLLSPDGTFATDDYVVTPMKVYGLWEIQGDSVKFTVNGQELVSLVVTHNEGTGLFGSGCTLKKN
jgi:hypothetical protein